jgi:hypothetical protein
MGPSSTGEGGPLPRCQMRGGARARKCTNSRRATSMGRMCRGELRRHALLSNACTCARSRGLISEVVIHVSGGSSAQLVSLSCFAVGKRD